MEGIRKISSNSMLSNPTLPSFIVGKCCLLGVHRVTTVTVVVCNQSTRRFRTNAFLLTMSLNWLLMYYVLSVTHVSLVTLATTFPCL